MPLRPVAQLAHYISYNSQNNFRYAGQRARYARMMIRGLSLRARAGAALRGMHEQSCTPVHMPTQIMELKHESPSRGSHVHV